MGSPALADCHAEDLFDRRSSVAIRMIVDLFNTVTTNKTVELIGRTKIRARCKNFALVNGKEAIPTSGMAASGSVGIFGASVL